ncbi:hypothetical protein LUZ60_002879 [Juncus effusus]|nr:hypothetical protein LUZ60_002879 [Juncus effusus]
METERGEKMKRKRVVMEKISHEPTRLATFKKRKACIMKKASELSILCSVPVCVIVSDGTNNGSPDIWPESQQASEIISRFSSLTESERTKKMVNKDGFIAQQIAKKRVQLERINRENQELEARLLLRNFLAGNCSIADVHDRETIARLHRIVEMQNREIEKRKEEQISVPQLVPVPVQAAPASDVANVQANVPAPDKNSPPLMDGSVEQAEFFDWSSLPLWFEGGEEKIPQLVEKSNGVFEGFSADVAVQQEGSGSVSHNNEKISESSSDVAAPDWLKSDEELLRLFEEFGDLPEMDDTLWSF